MLLGKVYIPLTPQAMSQIVPLLSFYNNDFGIR